jgi:hypothetical protein
MTDIPAHKPVLATGRSPSFAQHPPSATWERVVVLQTPELAVWAWYKLPQQPHGMIFKLTPDVWLPIATMQPLTLRQLLSSIDVEPAAVMAWSLYGVPYDAMAGTSPFFDQPIPPPLPGVEPDITVFIGAGSAPAQENGPSPLAAEQVGTTNCERLLDAIAWDWDSAVKLERQMVEARKKLVAMTNRLNILNRDLTPEENAAADRLDKSDWQDARRWLRDGVSELSRCIKQHDVGETSLAGKRDWFKQIYEQSIRPRRSFDGLSQAQREFEMYRKRCQTLLSAMQTALGDATSEGERRAATVLARIASKMRQARTKKSRG